MRLDYLQKPAADLVVVYDYKAFWCGLVRGTLKDQPQTKSPKAEGG